MQHRPNAANNFLAEELYPQDTGLDFCQAIVDLFLGRS